MSEKEHIEDVPHASEKEQEVLEALRASFLDRKFDSSWRPAKVQLIVNNTLVEEYQEKKQDFLVRGRKGEELKEKFGFFVENNVAILELITRMGLQGRDSEYNALGYNRMGVYLCKHADVCLQHALVKHSGSLVMRMVMCKYVAGRPTTAIPRVASAAEFIEPTQGFDCHESVINPDPRDSLQNKFDRSQVYLYEINKLLQPSPRPRQVQPFAVVSFTQNGAYLPIIDAEATAAERMASNVAQQNIANIINSKETLTPQPGAAAVMANPGPGIIGPAPGVGPQAPSPSGGSGGVVVPNNSPPEVVTCVQQNGINGHTLSPSGDDKDPVKSAVSQLNVKLGSEMKKADSLSSASPAVNRQVTPSPAPVAQITATNPVHSITAPIPSAPIGQNRLVRLPNGVGPGVLFQPYQGLPGVVPGAVGAAPFPGAVPAGLVPTQPGLLPAQPALAPGQPALIPGQPGLFSAPPGIFPAQPGLIPGQPGVVQGQPGIIQGQPSLIAGQAGLLPGGQQMVLPMAVPSSVGKPPSAVGMLPAGFPMFSGAGLVGAGTLPSSKTTTAATQLGQSRPITPEVPTAGYVANNVSGYTPAIMGSTAGSPNIGQPIPVLTNGTVQTLPASQQGSQQPTQQMMTAGVLPGMPGFPVFGAVPTAGAAAAAANMAAFPGLVSQATTPQVPQFTYVGAQGQQLNAVPQSVQKIGQNGLLQPAVVPVQAIPAQSLKRQIADPYGVIDKRIRLA